MKNLEWTAYSNEDPIVVSDYGTKMFCVKDNRIMFSGNISFDIDVYDFIVLCSNVDNIPESNSSGDMGQIVGMSHDHEVRLSKYNDNGTKIKIYLSDSTGWKSWMIFTGEELLSIIKLLKLHTEGVKEPEEALASGIPTVEGFEVGRTEGVDLND